MRKVIFNTGALITQGGAESTHCEVLPYPAGRLSGCDARSGHSRSAQSSCLVSETLTAQERDILAMIGQGLTNKRIGRAREISPETVKSHVKRIFSKANKAERYSVAAVKVATAAIDEAEQASLEAWLARADADYAQGKQTA